MIYTNNYYFGVNELGQVTITVKDLCDGSPVASIVLDDAMATAEHIARLAIEAETNTRMGTSEHRQKQKLKAIRKAMGYAYP